MEDVHHVTRPISDAARLWILGRENKTNEFLTVDPADLIQDRQRRQYPKRIADLFGNVSINTSNHEKETWPPTSGNFSGRPLSPPF